MPRLAPTLISLALYLCPVWCLTTDEAAGDVPVAASKEIQLEGESQAMRNRLAATMTRYARDLFGSDPLSIEGLASGTEFLIDATTLNPDSIMAWSMLLDAAILTERDDLIEQVLPALVRLAPDDTAIRFERLWLSLERSPTVDAKAAMIEKLVSEPNLGVVGPTVASALCVRLAMLERRAGDKERFLYWLDRAVELNSANYEAMALLAGVQYELEFTDPVRWTELLLQLYRSNPADSVTAVELGLYLLDMGAYSAASRMLELARNLAAANQVDPGGDLDADLAIALWASQRTDDAKQVLKARQLQMNRFFQNATASSDEEERLSPLEVASLVAPAPPKLAAITVLMAGDATDPMELTDAIGEMIRTANHADGLRAAADAKPSIRVGTLRRALWLLITMNGSQGSIEDMANRIEQIQPLDTASQAIYDAVKLSWTDTSAAETALKPLTKESTVASLVLAALLQERGLRRESATVLLEAWQRSPGTVMGILAGHRLSKLLGVALPMGSTAIAVTAVIDSLPEVFNRLPESPSLAVTLKLNSPEESVPVFGPVIIEITVLNHLAEPLSISARGPILDLMILQADVDRPHANPQPGPPIFVDIGQLLQLPPHGEHTIMIDLRNTWVGAELNTRPLLGSTINIDAVLNPQFYTGAVSKEAAVIPGAFGGEYETKEIRIDGQRVSDIWINEMLGRIRSGHSSDDALSMALLANVVFEQDSPEGSFPLLADRTNEITAALVEAWPRLGQISQSWLLSTIPYSDRLRSLWNIAERSTDPMVKRVALMRVAERFPDPAQAIAEPAVAAGLASDASTVRQLAEWFEARSQFAAEKDFGTASESKP
jgi:tetratricopeptide (TPR) repeat protein